MLASCPAPLSAGRLKLRAELAPGKLLDGCSPPESPACFLTQAFQAATTCEAAAATCSLVLFDSRLMRLPASVSLSTAAVTWAAARTFSTSRQRVCAAASPPSSTALAAASLALPTSFASSLAAMVVDIWGLLC